MYTSEWVSRVKVRGLQGDDGPISDSMFDSRAGILLLKPDFLFVFKQKLWQFMQKRCSQATERKSQRIILLTFLCPGALWTPVYLENLTLELAPNAPFKSQRKAILFAV